MFKYFFSKSYLINLHRNIFFTPQGFGQTIYDNYIFDIPRLFDICSLYAINNKELLT